MNILFCGDKNIEKGLLISILSLVKTCKEPIHFYILTISLDANGKHYEEIPQSFIDYLYKYIVNYNKENSIKLFNISELFLKDNPTTNLKTRFTPCCMLRLYADLVPEIPEKILYLDNDVICRRDISAFYNSDISKYEVAGVLDYYGSHFFKKNLFAKDYLNSGILLMNMKLIREKNIFQKCRHLCKTKKMLLPDQTAINKVMKKKKYFSHLYNDQRRLHNNTYIQHFTTTFRFIPVFRTVSVKPWDIDRVHSVLKIYEYDGLFGEYELLYNNYVNSLKK